MKSKHIEWLTTQTFITPNGENYTVSMKDHMFIYTWTNCPASVLAIVTNRLQSKVQLTPDRIDQFINQLKDTSMKAANYFIKDASGNLVPCTNLDTYGCYLYGFQERTDAGKLYTMAYCGQLVPVFDEKGNGICRPEYAGRDYKNTINN